MKVYEASVVEVVTYGTYLIPRVGNKDGDDTSYY